MAGEQALSSLQLVPFRDVLENVVQEAYTGLQQLTERLPALPDEDRKRQLLQHLQATRQRLQRLHVCAQWAHKAKAVNTCREVLKASHDHGAAFVHAADELFRLHEELRFLRAPLFDVSSSLHIMQTGNYRLLPGIIEDELQQPGQRLERPGEADGQQRAEERRAALRRVSFLLRSKLLATELPAGMRVQRVHGGQALVSGSRGQYIARLTIVPAPSDEVTLAKYRPPTEAEGAAGAVKEEAEVAQPAAAAPDGDQPSTSAAAAQHAAAGAGSSRGVAEKEEEAILGWRWQLLSFELLPAAAGLEPPLLLPSQQQWLQQHIEQRMWAAGDVEQLVRLGKAAWVVVPEAPSAAKEQQQQAGSRGAAPAPSSSQAPSQLVSDSKGKEPLVKDEPDLQQPSGQQQGQAEEGARQQLPAVATSALAAMHAILCQTAGRLALFSALLSDARQLEGGSWKGCLKLSRAASGSGIRFAYWQQVPVCSFAELQSLREGAPLQAAAADGTAAPARQQQEQLVEVSLQQDGTLAASSTPQLQHPLSGEPLQLELPLDSAASLSADRLLLQAAAGSAAMQLAAVQAVLQRQSQLAAAGIHSELVVPPAASSAAQESAGAGGLPCSPLLQLWSGGSLQLSLNTQLRSGRLLLAAGPALLESEQGVAAAAAVSATQQQLDAVRRDALTQPLPPGSTRAVLAATLAAGVLSRLSLQLRMRQRIDAAAADAAACGLRRATLPQRLLKQHLDQLALLTPPLSANTLTLALPAFPPPSDMQQWARQQQRRVAGAGGAGASAAVDIGATRCFLLLDFGDAAAGPLPGSRDGGGAEQPAPGAPRVLLALCSCTSRGTITRVLQLAELPGEVVREAQAAAAGSATGALVASRKRRTEDEAGGSAAAGQQAAAVGSSSSSSSSSSSGAVGVDLAVLAAWCRHQASWLALRSQMLLLPVQYAEELALAPQQGASGQRKPQWQPLIRLPKAPVLAELESWAAAQLASAGGGPPAKQAPRRPVACLRLEAADAEAAAGAWRVDISSLYFANLRALLERQGISLAPPAPDASHITAHDAGLTVRYSLQKGHSVLTAITDMLRVSMLHVHLTRLAACMAVNPAAAGRKAAPPAMPAGHGANGGLAGGGVADFLADSPPEPAGNGAAVPNRQLPEHNGIAPPDGLVWPLPGCGPVRLQEVGLTHMTLAVEPPPQPDSLPGSRQQQAVRVTVSWGSTLAGSEAGGASSGAGSSSAAFSPSSGGGGSGSGGGSSLRHIRCCVASEPPMPAPICAALAHQLEAGRADLFLDSLCLAAHSAAAAAAQLTPEAQRAAGLLPGALKLLGPGGGSSSSSAGSGVGAEGGASSALRLRAQLQHGDRITSLTLSFHAAGYTLLQLQPVYTAAAISAAASWLPALWQRLSERVPTFSAVDTAAASADASQPQGAPDSSNKRQLRQAWVHCSSLGAALTEVLSAVSSQPPAPAAQMHQ